MSALLTQEVKILRYTVASRDSTEDDVATYVEDETVPASVQPVRGSEVNGNRNTAIAEIRVFVAAGTRVEAEDHVLLADGRELEIVAPPARWAGLGGEDHVLIDCRYVEG